MTTEKKQSDKAAILQSKLAGQRDDVDEVDAEERRISGMMKSMGSVEAMKINVKGIISLDQIEKAALVDGAESTEAQAGAGAGQKNLAEKQHKSKVAALNRQIENATGMLETIKAKHQEQSQKAEELQEDVATKAAFNGTLKIWQMTE